MSNAKMIVHKLEPGSPEWLEHRANNTWNASDAGAMLGCSPHKSRTDLLDELHHGFSREAGAYQDRIRAGGHRFEALARPLVEVGILQEDLYPVVASRDWGLARPLGASFDGLTMARQRAWEHKQLNDELRAVLPVMNLEALERDTEAAQRLPKVHRVQMEQQLMVCPSAERVLFTASDWGQDGKLIAARHCWYYSNPQLREEILAGWKQLEADLASHTPKVHKERPVGEKQEALPALFIQVEGRIVSSNLPLWREAALAHIARINRNLKTDEDFANAKEAVKWCAESAKKIKLLKQQTLEQMIEVNELVSTLDTIVASLDRTRIDLDHDIDDRETAIRDEVAERGAAELTAYIAKLNERIGKPYMPAPTHLLIGADFRKAIKGRRTVKSLNDCVDAELARCKIAASAVADRIQINLRYLEQHCADRMALFADERTLVLKENDDFKAIADSRVIADRAAAEKREEAIREEERARVAREQEARDEAARPKTTDGLPAGAARIYADEPTPHTTLSPEGELGRYETRPAASPSTVVPLRTAAPSTAPTMNLSAINARLQHFHTSEAGLAALGFPATKDKGACLYHEADFPRMVDSIIAHARMVQAKYQRQAA